MIDLKQQIHADTQKLIKLKTQEHKDQLSETYWCTAMISFVLFIWLGYQYDHPIYSIFLSIINFITATICLCWFLAIPLDWITNKTKGYDVFQAIITIESDIYKTYSVEDISNIEELKLIHYRLSKHISIEENKIQKIMHEANIDQRSRKTKFFHNVIAALLFLLIVWICLYQFGFL